MNLSGSATDVEQYVGNPLNSFILIKKLTSDWRSIKDLISSTSTAEGLMANLTDTSKSKNKYLFSKNKANGSASKYFKYASFCRKMAQGESPVESICI